MLVPSILESHRGKQAQKKELPHATELSEFGVNPKEIQRRLGHKSLEVTTRRYIHATEEMQRQSVEIMNQMYQAR